MKRLPIRQVKVTKTLALPLFILLTGLPLILSFQNCSGAGMNANLFSATALEQSSKYSNPASISSVSSPTVVGGTNAVVQVYLSVVPTQPMTFQYQTISMSALPGTNYQAQSGSVVFQDGQSTATITIPTSALSAGSSEVYFGVQVGQLDVTPVNVMSGTVTIQSFAQGNQATTALYIAQITSTGMYLTTTVAGESAISQSYTQTSMLGWIYPSQSSTTMVELYRCQLTYSYYSTTSPTCEGMANYRYDGPLGFIDSVQNQGEVPLYRLYNATTGNYVDSLSTTQYPGFAVQKILGYVVHP